MKNKDNNEDKPEEKPKQLGKYCSLCTDFIEPGVDLKDHMSQQHGISEIEY